MDINKLFWNSSVEDLKKGYLFDNKKDIYICLLCGEKYENGVIYRDEDKFYSAEKMIKKHIINTHKSVFDFLIEMNKKYTGLSENQKDVLKLLFDGLSDQQVARELKLSQSTIRNYRFKFREKEKQAKIFTSLMELLKEKSTKDYEFVDIHKTASMIDDRYSITENERKKILSRYFDGTGKLIGFPAKEKRKIIILTEIASNFKKDKEYSEKEINRIIGRIYDDYVTIRRYLIEYGYLDRCYDGSKYWVK